MANSRKKVTVDLATMAYGKIPPQAKDLEEAILGACMLIKDAYETVCEILKPESFYLDAHQRIFRAFERIVNRFGTIDLLTTVEALKQTEELETIGGPYCLMKLTNNVIGANNLMAHAAIVQQKYYAREVIRVAAEAMQLAYEDSTDVFDLLDTFSSDASKIGEMSNGAEFMDMASGMFKFMQETDRKALITDDIIGVPTGFKEIDRVTGGIQPGDMVTIAAGTGDGKTTIGLNIAQYAASLPIPCPVAIFMLEVPKEQGMQKLVTSYTSSQFKNVRRGHLTDSERKKIQHAQADLERMPIFIDDTPGINYMQAKAKLKRLIKRRAKERVANGLNPDEKWLVIIDYVQLMKVPKNDHRQTKEQDISEITANLKIMAKELGIGVIILAQVNKQVKARNKGNRLLLGDIRDSAGVEMDSDIVMFLYKPDNNDNNYRIAEIAKHRNGELLTTKLQVEFWRQKFFNPGEETKKEETQLSLPIVKPTEQFDDGFEVK